MNACNAALGELQSLQIPNHHFKDAANIRMQTSDNSDCKCIMPDAVLAAMKRRDEPGADATPADANAKMDANAKPIIKQE